MTILTLRTEPDPILSKKTNLVTKIDDETIRQLSDMLETMYHEKGVGLAANQVGINKKMFVMDINDKNETPNPIKLINPEILSLSEDIVEGEEGCLSVPGVYADIERSLECSVKYKDENGKEQILKADRLMAKCIQHEIDHLNGVLFIDYLTNLKRKMVISKSRKFRDKK